MVYIVRGGYMKKVLIRVFAVVVFFLAIAGMFVNEGHLFGIMNADMVLDIVRIILAALLIYAGFFTEKEGVVESVLWVFTVLYIGLGLLGLFDAKLWGMLPNSLTGFDIIFHLGIGALGLFAALRGKAQAS